MDDMTKQVLLTAATSVIRHGLTTAAGALVTDGLIESGDTGSFVKIGTGFAMGVGGLGLSWWKNGGQIKVAAALKHLTSKNTTVAAVTAAQALPAGAAVAKAIAIFAVLLMSLMFALPAMAQNGRINPAPVKPALTGNIVKDFQVATGTAPAASPQTAAEKFLAALAKPFQDLASLIGEDSDAAVALATAIPDLQDGHGQQCWMASRQFAAVLKAHPVPVTFKAQTDLEALRLLGMAANNLCGNAHCTQVYGDLANAIQSAAPTNLSIPIPSLHDICSKIPQVAVVAPVTAPASTIQPVITPTK